jgi:regulator of ribosome biosynthesis
MSESSDEQVEDPTTLALTETDADLVKTAPLTATQADGLINVDLGHLMAFDPRPVDTAALKKSPDDFLRNACLFSTQLIVNKLFKLPTERVEDSLVVKLPKAVTILPREKPLPKKKAPTKWEAYAALKGIQKTKKSRKVWDDVAKEWRYSWGKDKVSQKNKQWLIEMKKNEEPDTDLFAKASTAKSERVAKNELQRLRNVARSTKAEGGAAFTATDLERMKLRENGAGGDKQLLKKQLHMAKTADASMSKFSEKLKDEEKTTRGLGKKRKFESNWDLGSEKEKQLKLFDKLTSNKDKSSKAKLNIEKAANKHIKEEDYENRKR